jgi:hypothetical protein
VAVVLGVAASLKAPEISVLVAELVAAARVGRSRKSFGAVWPCESFGRGPAAAQVDARAGIAVDGVPPDPLACPAIDLDARAVVGGDGVALAGARSADDVVVTAGARPEATLDTRAVVLMRLPWMTVSPPATLPVPLLFSMRLPCA